MNWPSSKKNEENKKNIGAASSVALEMLKKSSRKRIRAWFSVEYVGLRSERPNMKEVYFKPWFEPCFKTQP